jgi:hypothetical protein
MIKLQEQRAQKKYNYRVPNFYGIFWEEKYFFLKKKYFENQCMQKNYFFCQIFLFLMFTLL